MSKFKSMVVALGLTIVSISPAIAEKHSKNSNYNVHNPGQCRLDENLKSSLHFLNEVAALNMTNGDQNAAKLITTRVKDFESSLTGKFAMVLHAQGNQVAVMVLGCDNNAEVVSLRIVQN